MAQAARRTQNDDSRLQSRLPSGHHTSIRPWWPRRRLTRGDHGFQNLRSLKIEMFDKPRSGLSLIPDGRADPFRFACDGAVVSHTYRFRTSPKILQECLEKIFKFGCSKDKRGVVADMESENASETATSFQQEPRASRDTEA
jgi:hypothetical protein